MNRHLLWRGVLVIAAISGAAAIILARSPRLGLDLRGGTQIVLQAEDGPRQPADDDAVSQTLEVLRRRVDQLGVSEPSLQRSGSRRIIVELPGVTDPRQATEIIGKTAQMEFRRVLAFLPRARPSRHPRLIGPHPRLGWWLRMRKAADRRLVRPH